MRRVLPLLLLLALGACASVQKPHGGASKQLRTVVESYFDDWLQLNPVEATRIGDHRFDGTLGNDASLEHLRATKTLHQTWLEAAKRIDRAALNEDEQLWLDVFIREREVALEDLSFPGHLMPFSQMGGMPLTLAQLGGAEGPQPFDTIAQHDAWLSRANGFPAWVEAAIARMREGMAQGVTLPRVAAERLVPQLDALAEADPSKSVFAGPVKKLAPFPQEQRARLEGAYLDLITNVLAPSYARLRDFVRDEYLPNCRQTTAWTALPQGQAWYAHLVRRRTTSTMSVDDIHLLGQREVARILASMDAVRTQVGFEGDLPAFFAHLKDDPTSYFDEPEELLEGYQAIKRHLDAALPRLFSLMPKTPYEVRPVEAYRAQSAPGAEYLSPPDDGSSPGLFYVNTYNLRAQPKWGMETLALHEATPGHHFQTALQQEDRDAPRFRRFAGYSAYDEGWALYAESLGPDLGLFTDPMSWFGRLNDEQLRAMRLVVDTGLHAKGWSHEQAVAFMLQNSALARSDVEAEVNRYLVWPGQALAYKVGEQRMLAMRRKAEGALGKRFDVKAFHALVLRTGPVPLDLLEARVDAWIERQGGASTPSP